MNIKSIRLRNFRGFRDAHIELKPLTVLLGPNSSGKSAFGHALAAMAHVHKVYASTPQASLTPPSTKDVEDWPVDLGETGDLRTQGTDGPVLIALETRAGSVELGFGGLPDTPELLMSYVNLPSAHQRSAGSGALKNTTIETTDPSRISTVVPLEKIFRETAPVIELSRVNVGQWQETASKKAVSVTFDGLCVKAVVQQETGTAPTLGGAAIEDLRALLENLTYLRANRKRPSRGYENRRGRYQRIGYSGEWAPSVLINEREDVTYSVPPDIPNTMDEARTIDYEWKSRQQPLGKAVSAWLSRLNLAESFEAIQPRGSDSPVFLRAAPRGHQSHDITEVGFGVSQVVPILVAGLLQSKESLFIVDLPEAHLHPRPQSAFADFFCSLALNGQSAVVETHSEMFFHRLRLRVAMDPSLADKIAVYFIDPPKDGVCCAPRKVGLRRDDELRWPDGFLQEGWEIENQIKAVRNIRLKS